MARSQNDDIDTLSDFEVLELSNNGQFGPAIIGQALFDRAQRIKRDTNDGQFGPAITDPDYGKKEAAKRKARLKAKRAAAAVSDADDDEHEEAEGEADTRDPWSATTLSGAKLLAQHAGISYKPGIKKQALIAKLKEAGVVPPPLPAEGEDDDDDELEGGE